MFSSKVDLELYVEADVFEQGDRPEAGICGAFDVCGCMCCKFSKTQQSVTTAASHAEYAAMAQGLRR